MADEPGTGDEAEIFNPIVLGSFNSLAGTSAAPSLQDYAASARYAKETGGIVVSGLPVATDRTSQAMITGALLTVQMNPQAVIQWKGSSGGFARLDAAAITALAGAVSSHVQACFAAEAQVDAGLSANPPTITTQAEIDAVFAAIST